MVKSRSHPSHRSRSVCYQLCLKMPQSVPECLSQEFSRGSKFKICGPSLPNPSPALKSHSCHSFTGILLLRSFWNCNSSTSLADWYTLAPTEEQRLHRFQFHKSKLLSMFNCARLPQNVYHFTYLCLWTLWVDMWRQYLRSWWFRCSLDCPTVSTWLQQQGRLFCVLEQPSSANNYVRLHQDHINHFLWHLWLVLLKPPIQVFFSSLEHLDARPRMSALKSEHEAALICFLKKVSETHISCWDLYGVCWPVSSSRDWGGRLRDSLSSELGEEKQTTGAHSADLE